MFYRRNGKGLINQSQFKYMPKKFQFDDASNHIILTAGDDVNGRKILLDTGSPKSMGSGKFLGYPLTSMSDMLDEISEHIGENIDALLGGDILSCYRMKIDFERKEVVLDNGAVPNTSGAANKFPLTFIMSVPVIRGLIGGEDVIAVIDTGAKVSYAGRDFVGNANLIRTIRDFYPMMGEFDTPIFENDFRFGDIEGTHEWGTLPKMLEMGLLGQLGCQAIIGFDWLKQFSGGLAVIDYPNKTIEFKS